jgi:hypothetical protein
MRYSVLSLAGILPFSLSGKALLIPPEELVRIEFTMWIRLSVSQKDRTQIRDLADGAHDRTETESDQSECGLFLACR